MLIWCCIQKCRFYQASLLSRGRKTHERMQLNSEHQTVIVKDIHEIHTKIKEKRLLLH